MLPLARLHTRAEFIRKPAKKAFLLGENAPLDVRWLVFALHGFTSVWGCLVFVAWVSLEPLAGTGSPVGMPLALSQAQAVWRVTWLAFRVLGAVIIVPLAEELAFRGFLMPRTPGPIC